MKNNILIRSKFIYDPIHGEIEFDYSEMWLYELTQTKEFKRLLNIRQLGECWKVFHSATHTRFSHSVGVFHVCRQFLRHLNLLENIPSSDYNAILAIALLHDIGHGPRSHSFEEYTGINHEQMTKKIILSKETEINKILTENNIDIKMMIDILEHKKVPKFYYQLISGQIDSDRLDYLIRDSYFVGTKNGAIDFGIIIKWSMIKNNELVFDTKAISVIESIIFARYQMFKQIYLNKKTICYESIMKSIFLRLKDLYKKNYLFKDKHNLIYLLKPFFEDKPYDLDIFLKFDDNAMNLLIDSCLEEEDDILKKLCNSYLFQNQFTCDYEKVDHCSNEEDVYYYRTIKINKKVYDSKLPIMIYDFDTKKTKDVIEYWSSNSNFVKYTYEDEFNFHPTMK